MVKRLREEDVEVSDDADEFTSIEAQSPAKILELDIDVRYSAPTPSAMQCLLPPHHPISFVSAEEFDIHYTKEHTNRCVSCGKNLPSAHYLNLHHDERHNPLRAELAEKGDKTYKCLVEDCDKLCSSPQKRRLHLIDKHSFPKAYNFQVTDRGIDRADSLLQGQRRRRLSTVTAGTHQRRLSTLFQAVDTNGGPLANAKVQSLTTATEAKTYNKPVSNIEQLDRAMAALQFVPTSVQSKQRKKK